MSLPQLIRRQVLPAGKGSVVGQAPSQLAPSKILIRTDAAKTLNRLIVAANPSLLIPSLAASASGFSAGATCSGRAILPRLNGLELLL